MPKKSYMAVDQYGRTYIDLQHPRKDLCRILGRTHVDKMYCDDKNGNSYHVGYVIGGLWLTLYEVSPVINPLI